MHLFYQAEIDTDHIVLHEEESAHAIRVLRLKQGDTLHLTDGKGNEAICRIDKADTRKCELQVIERITHPSLRNYKLHIAMAPTKNRGRIEWFVEKAVECGINEISFVSTEKSERSKVNLERLQKIAVSAMKQSKQWYLPKIHQLTTLDEFVKNYNSGLRLIAWCIHAENTKLLSHAIPVNAEDVTLLVGPEGDFTANEVELAMRNGFVPVSLGKSILRSETAALYGCMAVKTLL
jgi:16S rRNA (uracil1498-N3)-methyltransferase